ncbi:hypothetical protein [Hydrogenophaga sp.]|uniref:hypothetical protein n=1 Tax=Hydrogenophaga sp. TaxID=1904254 RepID=UPI00271575F8|nr:hypothetical protein [Hydrogenophaga sp.]MDO9435242.1 hypothetical protein [Hydrogenophaga sp.]
MSPTLKISALAFVVLSAGCAQYRWQKAGATDADFNREMYACETEAARTFPPYIIQRELKAGYTEPSTTRCSGSGSTQGSGSAVVRNTSSICTTTPGRYVQPVIQTVDANVTKRSDTAASCMVARGYRRVKTN